MKTHRCCKGVYFLSAALVVLIAGLLLTGWEVRQADQRQRLSLLGRTRRLAAAIEFSRLQRLSGTPADVHDPDYQRLKTQLSSFRQAYPDIRFIYLMKRRVGGQVIFLIDNESEDSPDYVAPGAVYGDIAPEMQQMVVAQQEGVLGPVRDQWGVWMTGLVPVKDHLSGETAAVLGMDIAVSLWKRRLLLSALPGLGLTLLLEIMVVGSALLLARRSRCGYGCCRWTRNLEGILVAGFGTVMALFLAWRVHFYQFHQRQQIFLQVASGQTDGLVQLFNTIRFIELGGLESFLCSAEEVTPAEFARYASHLLRNSFVQAWDYVAVVPEAERQAFEQQQRQAGFPDFMIWEQGEEGRPVPAGRRPVYYPIVYFAPHAGNEMVQGYDLGSEQKRREAVEEAIRQRLPTSTEPLTLVQDTPPHKSIVLLRPLLETGDASRPVRGFALAAIRLDALYGRDRRKFDVVPVSFSYLYPDGSLQLLADNGARVPGCRMEPVEQPVLAFGKTFVIQASPGQEFYRAHPLRKGWLALLTGLWITAMLAECVLLLFRRRATLEHLVAERTVALGASEKRFNRLSEQSRTVFWECDAEGRYTHVNPTAASVFGYTPDEMIGRMTFLDLCPEADRERMRQDIDHYFRERKSCRDYVNPVCRKDGSRLLVLSNAVPILDEAGQLQGFSGFDQDVTERETLHQELKRSHEAAEAANRAKTEFLINISHEIRTPINGVIGLVDLLQEMNLGEEQSEYIDIIGSSSRLLLALVNELLSFSQIESGRVKLAAADFNLRQMVHDLVRTLAVPAHARDIEMVCAIPPDAPVLVCGDELRLQQVLMNLVGNAVKFTDAGEVRVALAVVAEDAATVTFRFMVRDTGIGIAEAQREKLFKPFTQLDSSLKRRHGGTGMGLLIARRLVELMGGDLDFTSTLGVGSEFFFTITLQKQAHAHERPLPLPESFAGLRVLVVDHNAAARSVLSDKLRFFAFRPEEAPDIAAATALLVQAQAEGDPFRLALVDLHQSGLVEPTEGESERDPLWSGVTRVALLPFGTLLSLDQVHARGFSAILSKPLRRKDFHELFWSLLSTGRIRVGGALGKEAVMPPAPAASEAGDILLAEDNPTNQKLVQTILREMGIRADLAANGLEALTALSRHRYRLVLMDVQMPVMDGLEATRQIRNPESAALDHQVPIVAMTAHAINGCREDCQAAGMNDCLPKPVTPAALRSALQRWLLPAVSLHQPPQVHAAAGAPAAFGVRHEVLLVEDNRTNQKVMQAILAKLNLTVDVAADGAEAVALLSRKKYALVFMDVQMPVMDGLEATRQIRDPQSAVLEHQVPVIAMTAHAVEGYKDMCLAAGMNDYLTKPVTPASLRITLQHWLGGE